MYKYWETKVTVLIFNNLKLEDSYEKITDFINYSFHKSRFMSKLHKINTLKHYSVSGLYPIEKDRVYKAREMYTFIIRTPKEEINREISKCLTKMKNDNFVVFNVENKAYVNKKTITHIDTLTPVLVTMQSGDLFTKDKNDIDDLKKCLINNMCRRIKEVSGKEYKYEFDDVVKNLTIKNKYAIIVNYKGIKMLGYKIRLDFYDDEISQDFAKICTVEGIGEKNSCLAMGFTKPYLKGVQYD